MLPGLSEVARYRANELTTNFSHSGHQNACNALQYGEFIDMTLYGGTANDNYYRGYSREAIGMGDWFGKAESMSDRIADGFHHSKGHWSYVGSSEYGVKWTDTRKNITYTTPEGKACRDSKLHLTKFLKESMEYEFIYRAQITAKFNNRNARADYRSRNRTSLRSGDRAELESNDIYAEIADRFAEGDSGYPAYADDRERTESIYGSAAECDDTVHRADQRSGRTVSDGDGSIGGGTDREYQSTDSGYRETGWENERELFEQHLYALQYGGGQAGEAYEQTVLDISDSFGGTHSVGTDAAYLIGDISNMIDEDAPVEDCTTMHQPRRQKKNTGPVMGGM